MELSRQAAIKRMVEEDMGVGVVPLQSVRDEVEKGRLVRWWIEGAQINWQLGLARLAGGYESPMLEGFIRLCHKYFETKSEESAGRKSKGSIKQKSKARGSR
jgi:DNA-binding transcriptional LysR family regulator